ncbi:MAG: O-methyltransferase [Cytophagaceae bacterium]
MKDYGAGSSLNKSNIRSISSISKYAEKPADLAQLLFRLVEFFKPTTIFELGTSLGLTTTYLSKAYPEARLYSFEGCPETLKKAIENFHCIGCQNITTIEGNIDDTLKETLSKISSLDFVFFDANHRYKPTLEYFNQCLKKINNNSVFIFDDIHWSSEMEKAWEEIKAHPSVNVSIDLFHLGIIFFRKEQVKEHFILRL